MQNSKKPLLGIIILTILIIVIPVTIFIINSGKTATLQTTIAPSSAVITFDNNSYQVNRDYKFRPTSTKATISADGFQSQEIDLELKDNETTHIFLYLIPEDGDMSWYDERPEETKLLLAVGGLQALQYAEDYHKKYPISTVLPLTFVDVNPETYEWTEFRIDGGEFNDCKTNDYCVKITDSTGNNHERALNLIREKGFNPVDYEIIYEYAPIEPLS